MSSEHQAAARGWAVEAIRIGGRQFLAENPPHVLLTAVLPRPVLQALFFVVLAGVLAGPDHREFVLVGMPTVALLQVAIMIGNLPVTDKWSGTFFRVRSGRPNPFLVMVLRALPYPVFGAVALAVCLLVVPPLTGDGQRAAQLAPQLPLYVLMAFTTCAAGLAVALLALGKRAEVFASNLFSYLILVAGGAFLPVDRIPFAGFFATVLPVHNGLVAVHRRLDGGPWLGPAIAEVAIGACWLAAGYLIMVIQVRRASRYGLDDYD